MRLVSYDRRRRRAGRVCCEGDASSTPGTPLGEPHRGGAAGAARSRPPRRPARALGDTGAPAHPRSRGRAPAAGPRPGEDHLHRAQLRRRTPPRRGPSRPEPDLLRQVPQRACAPPAPRCRCPPRAPRSTTRPRSRSSIGRRAKESPRPTRSTTSPATRCSTTSPPATCSSRRRSGWPARSSTAPLPAARRSSPPTRPAPRRDRHRARPQRRADAGVDHRPT